MFHRRCGCHDAPWAIATRARPSMRVRARARWCGHVERPARYRRGCHRHGSTGAATWPRECWASLWLTHRWCCPQKRNKWREAAGDKPKGAATSDSRRRQASLHDRRPRPMDPRSPGHRARGTWRAGSRRPTPARSTIQRPPSRRRPSGWTSTPLGSSLSPLAEEAGKTLKGPCQSAITRCPLAGGRSRVRDACPSGVAGPPVPRCLPSTKPSNYNKRRRLS